MTLNIALASLRDKTINAVRELSAVEVETLEAHGAVLRRYELDSQNFEHLSQEFVELEVLVAKFCAQLSESRGTTVDPRAAHWLMSRVQRHVINYLALFRAFEDHTDRRLSKRFGENSEQRLSYRAARAQLFDNNFPYRFLCKLRHFAQHKQVPVGHLGLNARAGAEPGQIVYTFEVGFLRDQLLAEDTEVWGRSVLKELREGPPILPVLPVLNVLLLASADLNLHVLRNDEQALRTACQYFEGIQREVGAEAFPVLLFVDPAELNQASLRDVFRMDLVARVRELYPAIGIGEDGSGMLGG